MSGMPSSMMLLYTTVLVTLWLHHDPTMLDPLFQQSYIWDYAWHSHNHTTFASMMVSLFTHADWEHVLGNMFLLWFTGRRVFVETAPRWKSPLAFVWIYFGSQVASVCGCRLLSHWLNHTWQTTLARGRQGWWNWVPLSARDAWSTLFYAPQVARLRLWQFAPIIGSSAAVYGVAGAHLYTSIFSSKHPVTMDGLNRLMWLLRIWMELVGTPLSLEQVSTLLRDNTDHASHMTGLLGGFLLAYLWEQSTPKEWSLRRQTPGTHHVSPFV